MYINNITIVWDSPQWIHDLFVSGANNIIIGNIIIINIIKKG